MILMKLTRSTKSHITRAYIRRSQLLQIPWHPPNQQPQLGLTMGQSSKDNTIIPIYAQSTQKSWI